jgi:hypothetical protein
LLLEYGFVPDKLKSNKLLKVLSRDKGEIVIKDGNFFYSNMGFDYPIKDIAALKKLHKELKLRICIQHNA